MAQRVLVPIDGSPQAQESFEYAIREFPDATLIALTVLDPAEMSAGGTEMGMASYADRWMEVEEERAEERFDRVRALAADGDVALETQTVLGRPARAIVEYAEDNDVDHVVMGSHGRDGVSRILLGSVAETVVRRSPCPVTVVR
ncbi:universal stress protein [Halalkalicoccus jeotgali]|uniref:UpsA domain-containing protein n=1 Tax=Halalkalicoccus jeotgali (strain DSM 18796 / CECT 7217 / JCM 14584 / KCTC 4019 / B3) TaxID=795797 RepID=D8JAJ7_HALJB|nr:universal stress protein [Halalkalicoccus jeotgali]ADJ14719.1 UpsA domain-containing protein [Halalkalicoccus jeotgali B3]ELY39515.1 UpsA domain-containing protein [Halalkalicoccus jeotgali B3]